MNYEIAFFVLLNAIAFSVAGYLAWILPAECSIIMSLVFFSIGIYFEYSYRAKMMRWVRMQ